MICAFPPPGLQTSADYRRVMTFLEGLLDDFFSSASTVFPGDARRNMQCNENGPLYPRCMRFSRALAGVATVGRWRSRLPSGSTEKAMSQKKVRVRCALRIQVEALWQPKSGRPVVSAVVGGRAFRRPSKQSEPAGAGGGAGRVRRGGRSSRA